jgi:hypothetical protein
MMKDGVAPADKACMHKSGGTGRASLQSLTKQQEKDKISLLFNGMRETT